MGRVVFGPQVSPARRLTGWVRALLLPLLAAGLSTCGPDANCLTSTGPVRTERRALPAGLQTVTAYDNVDLILVQDVAPGAAPYATVRAGENLLSSLETRVEGDRLTIRNNASCNWTRTYDSPREVTLHVSGLSSVFLRGSGNISTAGPFRQDTIFFHLVGAGNFNLDVQSTYLWADLYELGDYNLTGQTELLNLTVGGNGRFFGAGLIATTCYFRTDRDSNGDAHVTATQNLGGFVRGNGTFYYSGNPPVRDIRLTGRGRAQAVP